MLCNTKMHPKHALQWQLISAVGASIANGRRQLDKRFLETSDPFYPSPWMDPDADGWREAYVQAREFVSQLTLMEKVNLTTGVG